MGSRSSQIFVNIEGGAGKSFGCNDDNKINLEVCVGASAKNSKVLSNIQFNRWSDGDKTLGFTIKIDGQVYRTVEYNKKTTKFSKVKGKRISGSIASENKRKKQRESSMLKTVANIAAMGEIFGNTPKEKNDWKARMLKAGIPEGALHMPEDWDKLSEDEKTKRLDGAIKVLQS